MRCLGVKMLFDLLMGLSTILFRNFLAVVTGT